MSLHKKEGQTEEAARLVFEVKSSLLSGAGDGLFARREIQRGEWFPIRHSPPTFSLSKDPYVENLPIYLPKGVDMESPCVFNGSILTLREISTLPAFSILSSPLTKEMYVHASRATSLFMKANDFAYETAPRRYSLRSSAEQYARRAAQNKLELVLNIVDGPIDPWVAVHVMQSVKQGEEVGITYGHEYALS